MMAELVFPPDVQRKLVEAFGDEVSFNRDRRAGPKQTTKKISSESRSHTTNKKDAPQTLRSSAPVAAKQMTPEERSRRKAQIEILRKTSPKTVLEQFTEEVAKKKKEAATRLYIARKHGMADKKPRRRANRNNASVPKYERMHFESQKPEKLKDGYKNALLHKEATNGMSGRKKSLEWNEETSRRLKDELRQLNKVRLQAEMGMNDFDRGAMK